MIPALLLGLAILLAIGVPVAFALALAAMAVLYSIQGSAALLTVPTVLFNSVHSFTLTAVPMFILMGQFLARGGIATRLYNVAHTWLRHLPAGVGIATIVSCAMFAAISGSSTAIVAAIGIVALPELTRQGYSGGAAAGLIAAGATLGILIPPSIPLIIYGAVTNTSIGQLFAAGLIPGVIMIFAFFAFTIYRTSGGVSREAPASWEERIRAVKKSFWALLLPVFILGGIYSGIVTATEAAAFGAIISALLTLVVYRTIPIKEVVPLLISSAASSIFILAIVQGALLLGHISTLLNIPQQVLQVVTGLDLTPLVFIIVCLAIFVMLGCFLEVISILLITMPILLPVLLGFQIDLVWFAILMVITLEMALLTPPVGLNLYVIDGIARRAGVRVQQTQIMAGAAPYLLLMVFVIAVVLVVPAAATTLPALLYGD